MTIRLIGELEIREGREGIWVGVPGEPARTVESSADSVASFVRHGDDGRYRPLSGARSLPARWKVQATADFPVEAAVEAVYPLAAIHQRQFAAGELAIVRLDEVLERQSGRYESTSLLSSQNRALATATLCGECVRIPVWDGAGCTAEQIPCPEPCSVMVALCREAAVWQVETPPSATPDPSIAFAAFDQPGNELRERYLSAMINAQ